jgi:FAD dependent oxidoreductase
MPSRLEQWFLTPLFSPAMGKTVVLVEAGQHLGGMSVEGLGGTDIDDHKEFQNSPAVGGLALEF